MTRYLKTKEGVTAQERVQLAALSHNMGLPHEGQRYRKTGIGKKRLGAASSSHVLSAFGGERGCGCCGENSLPLRGSVL